MLLIGKLPQVITLVFEKVSVEKTKLVAELVMKPKLYLCVDVSLSLGVKSIFIPVTFDQVFQNWVQV